MPIVVGDRVCIGARSFITRGVKIEDDVLAFPGRCDLSIKAGSCVGESCRRCLLNLELEPKLYSC